MSGDNMEVGDEPNQPVATSEQTAVGNYFVANYPPFSFWTPDQREIALAALNKPPMPDTPLGVYVHIPFCRKRCHFCYFRVYTDRNAEQIGGYLDAVTDELKLYAERELVRGRKPSFVYFGGGTPSYLSVRQLTALADSLRGVLPWDEVKEVTFECEPGTLSKSKLEALRELGVTRLSFGVEHFDPHILEVNNRAHGAEEIYRAWEWAREVGFPQINIDLIAGMMDETDERWQECVSEALKLSPDSVTVYQMEIPYNTTIYKEMREQGKITAPVADWPTKRRWVKEAFERFEGEGYRVASAYTVVKKDLGGDASKESSFLYRDALWTGADLIGLGVASFGHLGGVHMQNQHESAPYESRVAAGELPIYRACAMTDDERLVRQFVLQLKLGKLPLQPFRDRFGVDPRERFKAELKSLEDEGHVAAINEDYVELTRDALLKVDLLVKRFFLAKHRDARYA